MDSYRIGNPSQDGYVKVVEGIERKTLVFGDKTLMSEFRLKKGSLLPSHKHPHEQTGYLVSGRIVLIVEGHRHEMRPGGSWSLPGNVEHAGEVLDDSVAVEIFCPVREDYLP
jgi:quercetin dioxygenase-like cupin family protein